MTRPLAIDELRRMPTDKALAACAKLDEQNRTRLFRECPATDHRTLLVLNVQDDWVMDDGFAGGISGIQPGPGPNRSSGDYGAVRKFLLHQRSKTANPRRNPEKAKAAAQTAWTNWFFPEYRSMSDVRARFTRIARDHAGIKAAGSMSTALYSLNGYFPEDFARLSAQSRTTCGLFVRSCRAAAGILERDEWPWNLADSGIDACIRGPGQADVMYEDRGKAVPKPGDIFHVNTSGTNDDHVGIILSHTSDEKENWWWSTIEAGQPPSGIHTKHFASRKLELRKGRHWLIRSTGAKPLVKWVDLERLASSVSTQLGRRRPVST